MQRLAVLGLVRGRAVRFKGLENLPATLYAGPVPIRPALGPR